MDAHTSTIVKTGRFLPIYLDSMRTDTVPEFDLYLEQGGAMILYRASRTPFGDEHRKSLLENNVSRLYVSSQDRAAYQRYLESNLRAIVADERVRESIRAGIVYDSARYLMEDLFARPEMGENILRSKELVETTVGFVLTSQAAFRSLLEVMSFDYSTYTHSVNVCALTLGLARHLGIRDPNDLKILGTGAMLHDIGKTRIDDSILFKTDPLSDDERAIIRHHPQWGCEIAKKTDLLDPESYYPILEHHERENSSGYPSGRGTDDLHLYGKMTALADVFDAMTTRRVYRPAMDAYPVLKTMFEDEGAFDRSLLERFAQMLGPSVT